MNIKESLNNSKKRILHKKDMINGISNEEKKSSENENEDNIEKIIISNKSIVFFQIFIFIIYFLVLLIGSFNFSFKLFQVREKHIYEFINNRKELICESYLKEKENNKKILYRNSNNLINNNNFSNVNFKYYFTRDKYHLKEDNKRQKNKRQIKIFICLNKKKKFYYSDFYNIFSSFKEYVTKFLSFFYNEIKNAFFKKNNNSNSINKEMKYYVKNDVVINRYLYYNHLLSNNNFYKNYYVNIELLFYLYLYDICYLHDFNYIKNQKNDNLPKSYMVFHKINKKLHIENKKDITLLINHINRYLNDMTLINLLDNLYFDICKKETLINYLKNKNNIKVEVDKHNDSNLNNDNENGKYYYDKENSLKNINYEEYYVLYNKIGNIRNVSKYNTFISKLREKIRTVNSLKSLNMCLKKYIINLKNIPLYFFLNIFYDTPCYVYNKLISNLLRNYYKGIFLYFVIFIGCIHVVFSPFPITLVHFRRFFIYFLIIMYRLFILYFIPSIIQYIIYKFHYFKEEYMHIFDYSDHVILFSTLLFIISLESKAIEYTINYQKQSFDYFHYKYNRKLCFFFLKIILYYYYILIFFFLYTSYFTSKYFHTTNEIFVAYFFSTFSIFFFFYFFLYKNYFSFYSIGITSYIKKNSFTMTNALHSSPYLTNAYNSLKDKFAFDYYR
ncbi:conserved Plasmodium protein, unknown function [Plasmodium relictum]|uniref:Uncharacterized protein n=1 Tax=Plasmodium relictum TaxID=85471 RepID=A0A1J1H5P3_PLARL|nr:conserved Plasmodium protein, unknown function [Plasmodium relictum]CRH00009.1 conserved Plasmodium protein, unknown function [Plasmodium relictum]